jgi:hypothetical protein
MMKRDGSFVLELFTPLKHGGKDIDTLVMRPITFEHRFRWSRTVADRAIDGSFYTSALHLLSDLTGLPELLLRQIQGVDCDRVTTALFTHADFARKAVMQDGTVPFATPDDMMSPSERVERAATSGEAVTAEAVMDQADPRFPAVPGTVKRFSNPPKIVLPQEEVRGGAKPGDADVKMDFGPSDDIARKVAEEVRKAS